MRLDDRQKLPSGMEEYLGYYGWHFSKKMCEWASSKMYRKVAGKKEYITPYTKESLKSVFSVYGIKEEVTYDAVYDTTGYQIIFSSVELNSEKLQNYTKKPEDQKKQYEGLGFSCTITEV